MILQLKHLWEHILGGDGRSYLTMREVVECAMVALFTTVQTLSKLDYCSWLSHQVLVGWSCKGIIVLLMHPYAILLCWWAALQVCTHWWVQMMVGYVIRIKWNKSSVDVVSGDGQQCQIMTIFGNCMCVMDHQWLNGT